MPRGVRNRPLGARGFSAGSGAVGLLRRVFHLTSQPDAFVFQRVPRVKPPALRPGDIVGIVAPASNIKRDWLEAGCAALERLGYKPFYFDSILEKDLYFAGSVERRPQELEAMFTREDVRAVLCARGGYGANYLLEELTWGRSGRIPRFSWATAISPRLLTCFADAAGLVTFHGPMVTKDFAVPTVSTLPHGIPL